MTKQLVFNEEPIELQLWKRTSTHQARFIPPFHTGTQVYLICIPIVEFELQNCQYDHILLTCLPEIEHFSPKAPILLVGTKLDLLEDEEKIEALRARRRAPMDRKQGEALAADLGLVGYLECSAATDDGVDQAYPQFTVVQ
ncbi:hypothetical protein DL96DRAFT_1706283 [Flagelloscypha sp. PMI_526]|nr:hypothetical protein DL96DRAFT_1706283 [Flagelloscypha sp. PMI_526]